ncbi:GerAB/ArcD/ProY family transporter [Halalkalibacter akibai]|uniref:Spore germination protein n=1 Tax=Halalkalibacter akibai (strain ATCC 43226 / DSM 21942 / CIP 109018 / JCM 9157 / 1139) TaxID=1236973 RepID=W4QQ73_HALA3|nr:GerAB/ArcD/ProY family transporter [Halalkalibacter akibai]GAE34260.1 spore germination protein [Halalkalibacter akibai JCM 9157]
MDTGNLKKLNKFHVVFLSQNVIIGIGLFTLSNEISMVGYNQWLIPIMLGVLANITLIPIVLLCKKFPDDSLFKINEKILGKLLGKMANGVLFLYGLMGAA